MPIFAEQYRRNLKICFVDFSLVFIRSMLFAAAEGGAVVSTTSPERLQMNIRAAASPLSDADVQFLEAED